MSSVDVVPLRLPPPPCTGKFILRDKVILFYASSVIKSCSAKPGTVAIPWIHSSVASKLEASPLKQSRHDDEIHLIELRNRPRCFAYALSFAALLNDEYKLKSCTTGSDASCTAQLFYFLMKSVNVGFNLVYIVKKFGFVAGLIN